MQRISPCLWFDSQAEEAANYYVSVFDNSKILQISRYGKGAQQPEGTVLTISFELQGQEFLALNGGPHFTFSEAISFQVSCESQEEVDHYWDTFTSDGGEPGQCGWLKDKYGLSWQIVPTILPDLIADSGSPTAQDVMDVVLKMRKPDIAELLKAANKS